MTHDPITGRRTAVFELNEKHHVNTNLKDIAKADMLDPREVKIVADALWSDVSFIDEYLEGKEDLPEEHREIIRNWKRRIQGRFAMERHLKKGSIFVSLDNDEVYQASGILSSWEDMFYGVPMPLIVDATFIPFRDVIISDGLVRMYSILVGSGWKKMLKDTYMTAKKNDRIHRSL